MYPGDRSGVLTLQRVTLNSHFNHCSSPALLVTERSGQAGVGGGAVVVVLWMEITWKERSVRGVVTYILDTGDCAPHRLKTLSTM